MMAPSVSAAAEAVTFWSGASGIRNAMFLRLRALAVRAAVPAALRSISASNLAALSPPISSRRSAAIPFGAKMTVVSMARPVRSPLAIAPATASASAGSALAVLICGLASLSFDTLWSSTTTASISAFTATTGWGVTLISIRASSLIQVFLSSHASGHCGFGLILVSATAFGLTLIPHLFSLGNCDLALYPAVAEVHARRDQRHALMPCGAFQLAQLIAVHKKFARAQRLMVVDVAMAVMADMGVE